MDLLRKETDKLGNGKPRFWSLNLLSSGQKVLTEENRFKILPKKV